MSALSAIPAWKQALLVGVVFAVLSTVATWPIITDPAHLSVVRPTENDYRLNNYFIFWGAHALVTDPLGVHHTNMFHPERYTFVYADILLAHSILMLPVVYAFYNPVLTFNIFLMAALTVGGVGFFLLARAVTGSPGAALFGALLWAFNPAHFTRYQQIQLFGDHWLPWLAWALWIWLHPGSGAGDDTAHDPPSRSLSSSGWAVTAAVFFCLNALSGSHNAVFGALLAGAMILYFGLARRLWTDRRFATGLLTLAVISIAALAPIFWPYLLVEEEMAALRGETLDLPNASLRPLELFSARSHFYMWLDDTVSWPSVLNRSGRELRAYAFPGAVTLLLAAIGALAAVGSRRRQRRFWILAAGLFLFLALGSYGGYLLIGNLPLIRLIRVPTRFMMPAVLAIAVLAAFGATSLAGRISARRTRALVFTLLVAAFAVEAAYAPLRTWEYPHEPRPLNQWLAEQSGDFAIVEFPLDPFDYTINMRQVFNSIFHWKKLLVGYSGYQSDENIDLLRSIRDRFPSDECLDDLAALDVRFVVVLANRVDAGFLAAVSAQERLTPAWSFEDWLVYRVEPRTGGD